jgi:hypothetical protein
MQEVAERNTRIWAWLALASLAVVAWGGFFLESTGYSVPVPLQGILVLAVVLLHFGFWLCERQDQHLTEHLRWRFGRRIALGPIIVIDFLLYVYSTRYRRHARYSDDR